MNIAANMTCAAPAPLNRADGRVRISSKTRNGAAVLDQLYQSGALKAVFPRAQDLTCVLVNTAGGLTGGDEMSVSARVGAGSPMTITTQAAERAYKARPGETGTVRSRIEVESGARLQWLPQETILFDGCALDRRLEVSLAHDAEALVVEPLILGRAAMGEARVIGSMRDRIEIRRKQEPVYRDSWHMTGDLVEHMQGAAIGGGATAMATLIYCGARADALIEPLRALLPETCGASRRSPDVLCARFLAADGYHLRKALLPVLDLLTDQTLPTCWRL